VSISVCGHQCVCVCELSLCMDISVWVCHCVCISMCGDTYFGISVCVY